MDLHHVLPGGDQDGVVGAVHISPNAESFCTDHVSHAHPCCLCVFVYECLLGSSTVDWTLGHGVVCSFASMRLPDSTTPET